MGNNQGGPNPTPHDIKINKKPQQRLTATPANETSSSPQKPSSNRKSSNISQLKKEEQNKEDRQSLDVPKSVEQATKATVEAPQVKKEENVFQQIETSIYNSAQVVIDSVMETPMQVFSKMQISPAPSKPIQPTQPSTPKMQGKENSKQNQAKMQKSEPATWESLVDKLKEEVTHSMEHNIALIKEYNDQQLTQTIQRIKSQTITSNPHLNPFYPSSDLIHFYGSKAEGSFSSAEMDTIRKLQRIVKRRRVFSRWYTLIESYKETEGANLTRERNKKIADFVQSERNFNHLIKTIILNYLMPLRNGNVPNGVSMKEIDALFLNLPDILVISSRFLSRLETQYRNYPLFPYRFRELFVSLVEKFDVFVKYIENYSRAISTLSDLRKHDSFRFWYSSIATQLGIEINEIQLAEYLIKPIRKFSEYTLFFTDILSKTIKEHKEHEDLLLTLELSKQYLKKIELHVTQAENILQVYEIQIKFIGNHQLPNFVKPYRKFLRYASLTEVSENSQTRFVVLFNDMIVIGSTLDDFQFSAFSSVSTFTFVKSIPLRKANIKLIPDHPPTFINSFMIGTSNGVSSFSCQSPEQLKTWHDDITEILTALESEFFSLESDESSSTKEGYLVHGAKRNEESWKTRWCSFEHGVFHICSDSQTRNRETSLIIKECRFSLLADKEVERKYCFELTNTYTNVGYVFGATDKDEFDQWVNVLLPACNQDLAATSDDELEELKKLADKKKKRMSVIDPTAI